MKVPVVSVRIPLVSANLAAVAPATWAPALADSGFADVSSYVEKLRFEYCTDMDNMAEIIMTNRENIKLPDANWLVSGNLMYIKFGYLGGEQSKTFILQIKDVECYYNDDVTILIRALDLGNQLKISQSQKIWKNLYPTQIVQAIASKYSMNIVVDSQDVYDPMDSPNIEEPQGNRTDYNFIAYLAKKYNKTFYCNNNVIYFITRDLSETSVVTYTYGVGQKVMGFEYHLKDSTRDKKSTGATSKAINPNTNASADQTGDPSEGTKTASYYFSNALEVADLASGDALTVGKKVVKDISADVSKTIQNFLLSPNGTDSIALKAQNDKVMADAALNAITATLRLEGEPKLIAGIMITMAGVAKRHSGNWYVTKVTHNLGNGAYITTAELSRNASAKPVSTSDGKSTDTNNSVGADGITNTIKLPFVDPSGQFIPVQ